MFLYRVLINFSANIFTKPLKESTDTNLVADIPLRGRKQYNMQSTGPGERGRERESTTKREGAAAGERLRRLAQQLTISISLQPILELPILTYYHFHLQLPPIKARYQIRSVLFNSSRCSASMAMRCREICRPASAPFESFPSWHFREMSSAVSGRNASE